MIGTCPPLLSDGSLDGSSVDLQCAGDHVERRHLGLLRPVPVGVGGDIGAGVTEHLRGRPIPPSRNVNTIGIQKPLTFKY